MSSYWRVMTTVSNGVSVGSGPSNVKPRIGREAREPG